MSSAHARGIVPWRADRAEVVRLADGRYYPFLSEHDWHLDSIRGEPRFGEAMARARREWARFDV